MDELLRLMHDTMNCIHNIKTSAELLKKESGLTPEEKEYLLNGISDRANRLNVVLDAYYLKKREDEKKEIKIQ
jgi:hypothetical protein